MATTQKKRRKYFSEKVKAEVFDDLMDYIVDNFELEEWIRMLKDIDYGIENIAREIEFSAYYPQYVDEDMDFLATVYGYESYDEYVRERYVYKD